MAGKIPAHFIDQLLSRVDILDIIGSRIALRKAGSEYQACCPFHQEKTPSFTVSQSKQFYHCFGCGAHGTAIGFLMNYDRLDFPTAVKELAQRAGLEVPGEDGATQEASIRPLFEILEQANEFFRQCLREHPQAGRAKRYLQGRGLDADIAGTFSIGYAPPGWDNLLQALGQLPATQSLLLRAGMLIETEDKRYDRFRDRIMFPIRDLRGRILGFGGRVLGEEVPKYLNSPETQIFHKGHELYGLYEARRTLAQINRLLVVEGYMDVVALAQHGIPNVVATLGTAATPEHMVRLFRSVREVVFCFDGDEAGRRAAWKALNNVLPELRDGREVRFLFLPEHEDPDSLVRSEGKTAFEARYQNALPLSDYLFKQLAQGVDLQGEEGRARLADQAKPLLNRLPQGVFRDLMFERLAKQIQIQLEPTRLLSLEPPPRPPQGHVTTRSPKPRSAIQLAIALLVQYPELAQTVSPRMQSWLDLDAPGMPLLRQLLELLKTEPNLKTAGILERWRDDENERSLGRVAALELKIPMDGLGDEFRGTLLRIGEQQRHQEIDRLVRRQAIGESSEEEKHRLRWLLMNPSPKVGEVD